MFRGQLHVSALYGEDVEGTFSGDADADDDVIVPVPGGDKGVPAFGDGGVIAVKVVPCGAVRGDLDAFHFRFFREAKFNFRRWLLLGPVFNAGEGVGDHGGGIVVFVAVYIGALVVDDFNVSSVGPPDDEVEGVRFCAVGENGAVFHGSRGGVAMPAVDFMKGVVGHEGGGAVVQDEEGAGVRLADEAAVADAAAIAEDMVREDSEVTGDVSVRGEVISVLVETARTALEVDDFVRSHDCRGVCGANVAVVVDTGVGIGNGLATTG